MSSLPKASVVELESAVIDGVEFARCRGRMRGAVLVGRLERLVDALSESTGELAWEVVGWVGADGKAMLRLQVSGSLALTCQRCLESLRWPCELVTQFVLVPEGSEWPEGDLEDDGVDAIPASTAMAMLPLLEDEVLLALPAVPRHEICRLPGPALDKGAESPFAALARLKKH